MPFAMPCNTNWILITNIACLECMYQTSRKVCKTNLHISRSHLSPLGEHKGIVNVHHHPALVPTPQHRGRHLALTSKSSSFINQNMIGPATNTFLNLSNFPWSEITTGEVEEAGIAVPGIFHTEKNYKIFILVHISLLSGLCLCHTNSFNSLQDILGCVMSTVFHPCHVTCSVSHLTLHTIHMATHVILSTRLVIRNVILFISGVTSTLQEHYWFKHLPNSVWKCMYLTNSFPRFCIIKLVG